MYLLNEQYLPGYKQQLRIPAVFSPRMCLVGIGGLRHRDAHTLPVSPNPLASSKAGNAPCTSSLLGVKDAGFSGTQADIRPKSSFHQYLRSCVGEWFPAGFASTSVPIGIKPCVASNLGSRLDHDQLTFPSSPLLERLFRSSVFHSLPCSWPLRRRQFFIHTKAISTHHDE